MKTFWGDMPITQSQANQLAEKCHYRIEADGRPVVIDDSERESAQLTDLFNFRHSKYAVSKRTILQHIFQTKIFERLCDGYKDCKKATEAYLSENQTYQDVKNDVRLALTFHGESSSLTSL